MLLSIVSLAHAAGPDAVVSGVGSARAVALLLQHETQTWAVPCRDDGAAPDTAADGRWTCAPLPSPGSVQIGVLRDSRFTLAGEADPAAGLAIRLTDAGATLGTDTASLPTGSSSNAAPRPVLLARVSGVGDGPAPVLRLQSQGGSSELVCRDDGVFPDRLRNDGEHGCLGAAPGAEAEVFLNGAEQSSSLGKVSWPDDAALVTLVVDVAKARAARAEDPPPTFVQIEAAAPAEPPPAEEPGAAPATPEDPGPQHDADPVRSAPPVQPEAPAVPSAPLPTPPLWMVGSIAVAVGVAWAFRGRTRRLPETLRVHPAPPLLPGGPGLSDEVVAFQADDPPVFAAALLPSIARQRRVVVVSRTWSAFPPIGEGPVYRSASDDCEEVEVAVRALVGIPGPAVAVLVVGEDALNEPGAVQPDPIRRLRAGLPAGVWLGVVVRGAPPEGLPAWTATGPPWTLLRT